MKNVYDQKKFELKKPRGISLTDSSYNTAKENAKELGMTVSQYIEFIIKNYKVSIHIDDTL